METSNRNSNTENLLMQSLSFQLSGNVSASYIESPICLPELQLPNFDGNTDGQVVCAQIRHSKSSEVQLSERSTL